MTGIKTFKASFADSRIGDLQRRLKDSIYPDKLDDAGWNLGAPLADVKRLAKHWSSSFDWTAAEQRLNKLPQYTTSISCDGFDELSIHFVHVKSSMPNAIPLLFCHGWPGSYIEVTKIAEQLAEGSDGGPAFHVVAPSLPNFGFSQGVRKRGFAIEQYAETVHKLMSKLGYETYATQGGDWGWYVNRTVSLLYPASCLATHYNMDVAPTTPDAPTKEYQLLANPSAREKHGYSRTAWFDQEGFGYNLLQSTKPQTLAYALSSSPLALLAWIYEKLHDWTDGYPRTDDEICTWVSIYWFSTAGPGASARIYYEMMHDKNGKYIPHDSDGDGFEGAVAGKRKVTRRWLQTDQGTGVKIGQSHFPNDIHVLRSAWTRKLGNVVFEREHENGGHFAAWEKPEAIVQDLRDMFASGTEAGKL